MADKMLIRNSNFDGNYSPPPFLRKKRIGHARGHERKKSFKNYSLPQFLYEKSEEQDKKSFLGLSRELHNSIRSQIRAFFAGSDFSQNAYDQ
jgi:hypothetical protein